MPNYLQHYIDCNTDINIVLYESDIVRIYCNNHFHLFGVDPDAEIRIVLLGKTGNGKSASGNTILSRTAFESSVSPCSLTRECEKARGTVDGRRVAVIDTPGMYDTDLKEEEVVRRLKECISLSAPGPHAFLIVIGLGRFTEEEQKTVELLQMVFGEKAADYSMVLFTHGDKLQDTTIEDFFSKSHKLSCLITKCNRRYHVFNNMDKSESQVTQLLVKIENMVGCNGGIFYTNEILQEAERAIQAETEKIMRETAEQKRREEEELKAKYLGEQLLEKKQQLQENYKANARKKAEKSNAFIKISTSIGIGIGMAAGGIGGPLCVAMGAVVGGGAGAIIGAKAKALKKNCSVM